MCGIHRRLIAHISDESLKLLKQTVCSRIRSDCMAERFETLEMANDVRHLMLSDYVVIREQTRACPTQVNQESSSSISTAFARPRTALAIFFM